MADDAKKVSAGWKWLAITLIISAGGWIARDEQLRRERDEARAAAATAAARRPRSEDAPQMLPGYDHAGATTRPRPRVGPDGWIDPAVDPRGAKAQADRVLEITREWEQGRGR